MGETAYFYQLVVGGTVFAIGLGYAARQGYVGLGTPRGRRNLGLMAGVAAFYLGLQGYLQFAPMTEAAPVPYRGGADDIVAGTGVRGAWIDYVIMAGYFLAILAIGTWFGRKQKTTKDFFFGGQRFAWWLIAFSLIATTIGSYSFVKYSNKGYGYGLSSSQTYMNDWIWLPLVLFGWLPILYFSRITSVPEYFGRRFGPTVRLGATICILIYLVGYVGVNLFTMGKVLNALVGWPIPLAALGVAVVSATYVTAGGQTSVIMTDLFQGVMLLVTGLVILYLGMDYLGGPVELWENLPRDWRKAYPNFNEDPGFPSVGIFWQDAIANSAMFYFLNQGVMMRFVATRSLKESRKAGVAMVLVLMVVAAAVVGGGGWVARALVNAGHLPDTVAADQAFYVALDLLSRPGVFGLVLAALTAALMSTVDTLITAVSAVVVNDIYRPYIRPAATDAAQLRVARVSALLVTVLGVALVPLFMMFKSIYDAHGAFTAAVTPPLVVTLLFSVFWRRYTRVAALATLFGGLVAMAASIVWPQIIAPFAHGVPLQDAGDGALAGMTQYKYMRACFGIAVCAGIGVAVTLVTRPEPLERQRGLVWGTVKDALLHYKGSPGDEDAHAEALAMLCRIDASASTEGLPQVSLSAALASQLSAKAGDLLYVSDRRRWLGGLRSVQARVAETTLPDSEAAVGLDPDAYEMIAPSGKMTDLVRVERLY